MGVDEARADEERWERSLMKSGLGTVRPGGSLNHLGRPLSSLRRGTSGTWRIGVQQVYGEGLVACARSVARVQGGRRGPLRVARAIRGAEAETAETASQVDDADRGSGSPAPTSAAPLLLNGVRLQIEEEVGQILPDHLLPQLACFASFGVEVPELSKLSRMQLTSKDAKGKVLKIPEDVLRERLAWYDSCFDLTGKELGKAVCRDPRILQCSPETTTAKRVQYLTRRGVDKQQLTKVFKKSPQFFRLDVTKSMEPRFTFFEQLGIPKAMHPALLVKDPAIMNRSITSMEENALFLLEIGFDPPSLQVSHRPPRAPFAPLIQWLTPSPLFPVAGSGEAPLAAEVQQEEHEEDRLLLQQARDYQEREGRADQQAAAGLQHVAGEESDGQVLLLLQDVELVRSRPEHVASGAVAVAEGQDLGKAPISGPEGTLRQGL